MSLSRVLRKEKSIQIVKAADAYLKHVINREFNGEMMIQWNDAMSDSGVPKRLHGDAKSLFRGRWTVWLVHAHESGEAERKTMVHLCNPGNQRNTVYNKDHMVFAVEAKGIEAATQKKDGATCDENTKIALKEAYEFYTRKPLA